MQKKPKPFAGIDHFSMHTSRFHNETKERFSIVLGKLPFPTILALTSQRIFLTICSLVFGWPECLTSFLVLYGLDYKPLNQKPICKQDPLKAYSPKFLIPSCIISS